MRRSLIHFWRIHLAVALGVGVATAVLTGALLVGDSVRASLRDLSLDRLGKIDHALTSERFFRADIAKDLSENPDFQTKFTASVPAINLRGTAVHANAGTRASRVQIQGIDNQFTNLFETNIPTLRQRGPFPSVVINESLRHELNAQIGDPILLSFARPSDIHRESLFGRNEVSDALQTLRLTLTAVLPDRGIGRFGLHAHQSVPRNAFVSLPILQKALGQQNRVNTLLISGDPDASAGLQAALSQIATLDDLGLILRPETDYFAIESTQFVLKPHQSTTIQNLAENWNAPQLPILTYLANTTETGTREIPYSTISAIDVKDFGTLSLINGSPAPLLNENEIFLNAWATEDLNAKAGDEIEIAYYEVGTKEELTTRWKTFQLKGIVAMSGLGADPTLSPEYPGLQDADDMSAWDAPFPVELKRIRPKDEAYWDDYRGAPKAFVSLSTGQQLWQSRFGNLTAIRIGTIPGQNIQTTIQKFQNGLCEKISPESAGLIFQPVKQQGLTSSSGATDFSGLFIGFSQFLIVSAALLVGLLFRLGVEQRAGEVGMLMVSGFTPKKIRKQFISEGVLLACIGGALGLSGGIVYAYLMMAGLRTWWVTAVGTSNLFLHVQTPSLIMGYTISLAVVLFAIWRTVRRLGQVPIRSLLSNVTDVDATSSTRRTKQYAFASLILAIGCLVSAIIMDGSAGLFFGSGAFLMISGLCFLSLWFKREQHTAQDTIIGMGIQNSMRKPGRSLLCASLIGCACFVIVAVGANRRTDLTEGIAHDKTSGTGGYALMAEVDVSLYHDLNSEEGQFELGFSDTDMAILNQTQVMPFRALPGEDVSCLNLYQPETPRVLGVPDALIRHGGFTFQQTLSETDNPWSLLQQNLGPGVIPAVGDFNSVMWILHKQLGDDIVLQNEAGEPVKLRLVGLLKTSIFQSELLISEANFLKHFPDQSGYGYFLFETDQTTQLTTLLERHLKDVGLDAMSTTQKLAHFQAVENTYLSTFQTLGGLGLLLGTLGLGIVLLRNVIERRGELAALRAFGFRRSVISQMLLAENGFTMLTGLVIGTVSALIAVAPHIISHGTSVPWQSLGLTLSVIYITGLIASSIAVYFALRAPLLPALKQEI
ncbi:MAG: ABC transporter permease [Candidatus Latescibacteria bacterium]|nr:ABC transporter permease [Candidatus Latescibacterota bacterium]